MNRKKCQQLKVGKKSGKNLESGGKGKEMKMQKCKCTPSAVYVWRASSSNCERMSSRPSIYGIHCTHHTVRHIDIRSNAHPSSYRCIRPLRNRSAIFNVDAMENRHGSHSLPCWAAQCTCSNWFHQSLCRIAENSQLMLSLWLPSLQLASAGSDPFSVFIHVYGSRLHSLLPLVPPLFPFFLIAAHARAQSVHFSRALWFLRKISFLLQQRSRWASALAYEITSNNIKNESSAFFIVLMNFPIE